jgi:hypothetical protein
VDSGQRDPLHIECRHCFNSSGPRETSFGLMTLAAVSQAIAAAAARGVREIYFTAANPSCMRNCSKWSRAH